MKICRYRGKILNGYSRWAGFVPGSVGLVLVGWFGEGVKADMLLPVILACFSLLPLTIYELPRLDSPPRYPLSARLLVGAINEPRPIHRQRHQKNFRSWRRAHRMPEAERGA